MKFTEVDTIKLDSMRKNSALYKQTMVLVYGGPRGQKNMTIAILLFTALYYSSYFFSFLRLNGAGLSPGSFRYFFQNIHQSVVPQWPPLL